MNQQQLILTKLLGKKELSFGCTIKCKYIFGELYYARLAGVIPKDGGCGYDYIDEHGNRLNTKQFEIIGHPAYLHDFHKWLVDSDISWRQTPAGIWIETLKISISYDSSKDLLKQSTETLAQIIELITNNS